MKHGQNEFSDLKTGDAHTKVKLVSALCLQLVNAWSPSKIKEIAVLITVESHYLRTVALDNYLGILLIINSRNFNWNLSK